MALSRKVYNPKRKTKKQPMRKAVPLVTAKLIRPMYETRQKNPFPPYKFVCLKYGDIYSGSVASGAGATCALQVKLNSLHDPQGTLTNLTNASAAGGHQPYYYDQVRPMYGHYIVTKVKMIVKVISTGYTCTILRDNSDNSTVPTNFTLELDRPNGVTALNNGNGSPPPTLTKTWTMHKLAGLTSKEYMADPAYAGGSATSADPTNLIYANLTSTYMDNYTGFTGQFQVTIYQWAKFFDPEEVAQS